MNDEEAYRLGYCATCAACGVLPERVAGAADQFTKSGGDLAMLASRVADYLGPMVLGVPVLLGAGAGALTGKLMQSTPADVKEREMIIEQDGLEKATNEVNMRAARNKRRLAQLLARTSG